VEFFSASFQFKRCFTRVADKEPLALVFSMTTDVFFLLHTLMLAFKFVAFGCNSSDIFRCLSMLA